LYLCKCDVKLSCLQICFKAPDLANALVKATSHFGTASQVNLIPEEYKIYGPGKDITESVSARKPVLNVYAEDDQLKLAIPAMCTKIFLILSF